MNALIAVVAVAFAGSAALCLRPLVAIPGGLLATLAWFTASAYSTGHEWAFFAVLSLVMALVTAFYTVEAALTVTRRERDRTADTEQAEEAVR